VEWMNLNLENLVPMYGFYHLHQEPLRLCHLNQYGGHWLHVASECLKWNCPNCGELVYNAYQILKTSYGKNNVKYLTFKLVTCWNDIFGSIWWNKVVKINFICFFSLFWCNY
jgi:hypothetical protein